METEPHITEAEQGGGCSPIPQPPISSLLRRLPFLTRGSQRARDSVSTSVHVPNYVWCTVFTAVGGFLFGFDTGSIGPVTVMPQFQRHFFKTGGNIDPTTQGLIVSSILLTASLASLFSGPLSNRISRTRTMALGAIVFAIGSAVACASGPLAQLFLGRCIAGAGEGLFLSAITVYTIEIAPASSRGRLGSVVQLLITMGIASGYFVCYGTSRIHTSLSWRFPLGMQATIAAIFAAGCPFLPHSPRWLHHVGRHADARVAWEKLGVSAADVEKTEETAEREETRRGSFWDETKQMFKKGIRGRTALGVFLSAMQQASGIDGVLYYAPVLFSQAGLSGTTSSFVASGVSGLINVVFTFGCQFFTDTWGRRPSMIRGGSVIALSMLTIGSLYASGASDTAVGRWSIIVLIYVFVIGFTCSWAICVRIITSEIQPTSTRAAVSSLGQCANWAVNWIIAFTTPLFLAKSSSGPYFLFGGCSILTTLVCLAFQPETRGSSLEEVEQAFNESPWRSILKKRPFIDMAARRRAQSNLPAADDEGIELADFIQLPEASSTTEVTEGKRDVAP